MHGRDEAHKKFLENLKQRDHLEDLGMVWGHGLDLSGTGYSPEASCCEYCNEPPGSV